MITILFQIVEELLSLLQSFGVLDTRNRLVWTIGDFLYRITEPALRPIRNILPSFGSIDISPVILLVLIWFLEMLLARVYQAIVFGNAGGLLF